MSFKLTDLYVTEVNRNVINATGECDVLWCEIKLAKEDFKIMNQGWNISTRLTPGEQKSAEEYQILFFFRRLSNPLILITTNIYIDFKLWEIFIMYDFI